MRIEHRPIAKRAPIASSWIAHASASPASVQGASRRRSTAACMTERMLLRVDEVARALGGRRRDGPELRPPRAPGRARDQRSLTRALRLLRDGRDLAHARSDHSRRHARSRHPASRSPRDRVGLRACRLTVPATEKSARSRVSALKQTQGRRHATITGATLT